MTVKSYTDVVRPHMPLSTGVLDKYEAPADAYISLLKIPELRVIQRPQPAAQGRWSGGSSGAVFGAAVTLSELIAELEELSKTAGYRHCAEMARHLRLVANTPVRNAATWAGNLMIKYKHRTFPSDVFLLLTAARAKLKIGQYRGRQRKGVFTCLCPLKYMNIAQRTSTFV